MLKLMISGAVFLIAGAVQFALHLNRTPSLEDFLAFRCGSAASPSSGLLHIEALASAGHCWGCYAMVLGAMILAGAAFRAAVAAGKGTSVSGILRS